MLVKLKFLFIVNGELIESMLSSGPMCRYASDLRLLFKIHAGDLYKQVAVDFESKVKFKCNLKGCLFYGDSLLEIY